MSDYQEYPLVMTHPQFRRALQVPIPGTQRYGADGKTIVHQDYQGTPEFKPPVTAEDATMEAYYRSEGYERAGKGDPAAFSKIAEAVVPPDFVVIEYPKWVNGKIVNNAEEEAEAQQPSEPLDIVPNAPDQRAEPPQGAPVSEASAATDQSAEIEALKAQIAEMAKLIGKAEPKPSRSEQAKAAWAKRKAKADAG